MMEFRDRVVMVTGASRGFGFAAGRALGSRGAHVIAVARTVGGLEDLDDAIGRDRDTAGSAEGGAATLVPLDIADDPALERMGAAIHGRWGRVDLWLHTAIQPPPLTPVGHLTAKDLDRALATDIRAFQRLVRVVDPLLQLSEAGLALIAAEDRTGQPFFGPYAAMKAAQSALTRAWAAESAKLFRVAEVVPPPMPTALRGRYYPGEDRDALTQPAEAASRLMARLDAGPVAPGERIVL